MMTIAEGDVYRWIDEHGAVFELTAIAPVSSCGAWTVGTRQVPTPILGCVWIGELRDPFFGTGNVLCTPEGLADNGFALVSRTDIR